MGLTVHYSLQSTCKKRERAIHYLEKSRQMAMDFPFEDVGEMYVCNNPPEDPRDAPAEHRWMHIQAKTYVDIPWTVKKNSSTWKSSIVVNPLWLAGFTAYPGEGCESMEVILAEYPKTIEVEYNPEDDVRFKRDIDGQLRFDWEKWRKHYKAKGKTYLSPSSARETRKIKVRGSRFRSNSFCKTQYASEKSLAHFLKCHVLVCCFLRKIETLPTMKVTINDEGEYETYTHDGEWQEGKHDVKALVQECGEWNEMIAGMVGGLDEMLAGSGMGSIAPIKNYANFEHLEAKGQDLEYMEGFLKALSEIPKTN